MTCPFITLDGNSALNLAALYNGHTDIVVELVKAGAHLDFPIKSVMFHYCLTDKFLSHSLETQH